MRGARLLPWLLAWAGAALPVARGDDGTAEQNAFLEMVVPRDTWYVQERIPLKIRVGIETGFLEARAIQLFRQRLDMPVQVQAPWLAGLAGAVALEGEEAAGAAVRSFVLGERVTTGTAAGRERRDDRWFEVLEFERTFLPASPGELVIPAATLRLAYATQFEEDFFGNRVAVDRHDAVLTGRPLTLRILPLPEEGRPAHFGGAVGHFSIAAEASPQSLQVGESLKLVLRIEGAGNLEFFDPPVLDDLEGFHVYGSIEDRGRRLRLVTYDLAPRSAAVKEVPPIPFSFFDTGPPVRYRTVQTAPIPLQVVGEGTSPTAPPGTGTGGDATPAAEAEAPGPGHGDLFGLKSVAEALRPPPPRQLAAGLVAGTLLGPWLLALAAGLWLRARAKAPPDPAVLRARAAAAAFREQSTRADADGAEALAEYLAARLRLPAAAVIDPQLPRRLTAAGVPGDLAARTAAHLETLTAMRYGGATAVRATETTALVEELEALLRAADGESGP